MVFGQGAAGGFRVAAFAAACRTLALRGLRGRLRRILCLGHRLLGQVQAHHLILLGFVVTAAGQPQHQHHQHQRAHRQAVPPGHRLVGQQAATAAGSCLQHRQQRRDAAVALFAQIAGLLVVQRQGEALIGEYGHVVRVQRRQHQHVLHVQSGVAQVLGAARLAAEHIGEALPQLGFQGRHGGQGLGRGQVGVVHHDHQAGVRQRLFEGVGQVGALDIEVHQHGVHHRVGAQLLGAVQADQFEVPHQGHGEHAQQGGDAAAGLAFQHRGGAVVGVAVQGVEKVAALGALVEKILISHKRPRAFASMRSGRIRL